MDNINRIRRKIKRKYKRQKDNLYSYRFYSDLFSGYAYSLGDNIGVTRDFFRIISSDKRVKEILCNDIYYNFYYELEKNIDNALYSLATFGVAYLYIEPKYKDIKNENAKIEKELLSLKIFEIKGIPKGKIFYYRTNSNKIGKFNISEGTLIVLNLKELGYKKSYFKCLVKKIGKCDITSSTLKLLDNELNYDFDDHANRNKKLFLKYTSDIGWNFENEGISDSYILYRETKERLFKIKFLKYILEKINNALKDNYIEDNSFKIEAAISNIDYENIWKKFQQGELTVSDFNKILWKKY